MLTKWKKKDIIRYIVALVWVVLFLGVIFHKEEKALQYDVVMLGDSVLGNTWGEVSVDTVLAQRLGKTVFNGAFGGSSMSVPDEMLWGSFSGMEWCMVKLAEAIAYEDWKSQGAVMHYADSYKDVNLQVLDYFGERMDQLMQIDLSKVEILFIEHGTNDYNNGKRLDNPEDLYDVTTFGGALRYSLSLIQEKYPQLRIVLVSPIYCALGENKDKQCYDTSYGEGSTLDAYVELEKQIAEEFDVEWIDAYHESGIWEDNMHVYMHDGLHPSTEGHAMIGNMIADYLEASGE